MSTLLCSNIRVHYVSEFMNREIYPKILSTLTLYAYQVINMFLSLRFSLVNFTTFMLEFHDQHNFLEIFITYDIAILIDIVIYITNSTSM